jgi:hypothetical protein
MSERSDVVQVGTWTAVTFIICCFLLIVLFSGEPDLLDAIIERVKR